MKRVIDNKFIELTDSEWNMYQEICKSYDRPPSIKGSDLFTNLFETDNDGIITFIRPPSTRQTSLECYLFITSIFNHQHMRLMQNQIDTLCANIKAKADKLFKEIKSEAEKTLSNKVVADKPDSK